MSINLTLEKPETSEEPAVRYTKRIDDLIEDAEIEAEIEAERKVRAKNTKIVAISAVAAGLLGLLYFGISYQTTPPGPASTESPEIAKAPPAVTPKPIPFPVDSKPAEPPAVQSGTGAATTPTSSPEKTAVPAPSTPISAETKTPAPPAAKTENPAPAAQKSVSTNSDSPKVRGTTLQAMKLPPARNLNEPTPAVRSFQQSGTAAQTTGYFVQVGAFSRKANAERLAKKLKTAGFESTLGVKTVQKKTVHVVQVGGFASSAKARDTQSALNRKGFKNTFVFFSKNS